VSEEISRAIHGCARDLGAANVMGRPYQVSSSKPDCEHGAELKVSRPPRMVPAAPSCLSAFISKSGAGRRPRARMRASKMMDADSHQRIRSRAYSLWEQEGGPDGRAESTRSGPRQRWRASTAVEMRLRARPARASTSARRAREPDSSAVSYARNAAGPAGSSTPPDPLGRSKSSNKRTQLQLGPLELLARVGTVALGGAS
jgi:DUF2934 family protein